MALAADRSRDLASPVAPSIAAGRFRRHARSMAIGLGAVALLLLVWWLAVLVFQPPPFILPRPGAVLATLVSDWSFLAGQARVTAAEMVLGLLVGAGLGIATALLLSLSSVAERLARPVLIISQALPVFAIAPLLVLWFGFGMASKVVMAALIIYFPVASAFLDGLRRTDPGLLDLARLNGARPLQTLRIIRVPAALPALASGLRVAATIAPIGAVVGEWVGASAGLGFVMLQANARMQTDQMFAALALLAALAIALRLVADGLIARLVPWDTADGGPDGEPHSLHTAP
ncbi:MAG: ABC transporter permease [Pseudomonadota bacterium]